MAYTSNPDIDQLIAEQTKFINGIQPATMKSTSTPVIFSNQFQPTLDQMLSTGRKTDTSAIGQAARSDADLAWRDIMEQINASMVASGGGGSSASAGKLARAGSDIATRMGSEILRAGVAADEAAAGRSLAALDPAMAHAFGMASSKQADRGLDLQQYGLDQSGRLGQAGAGQDLIDALLRSVPMAPPSMPTFSGNTLANRPVQVNRPGVAFSQPAAPRPPQSSADILRGLYERSNTTEGFGGFGGSGVTQIDFNRWLQRNPALVSLYNPTVGGQIMNQQSQTLNTLNNANVGMAGAASPLFQQSAQNKFLNDLATKFGPAFAFGG